MYRLNILILLLFPVAIFAQPVAIDRVEPPCWWTGFKQGNLQLMIHGKSVAETAVTLEYPGVELKKVNKTENPNYLFLDLLIGKDAKPGTATILFRQNGKVVAK